jgi:hypothetical protein
MSEFERRDYEERLRNQRYALWFTAISLATTLMFGVRAWASLPERVQKLEQKQDKISDDLGSIRAALARIEGALGK